MKKEIREIIENEEWAIYEDENGVDLRKYSNLGEDFGFYVDKENLVYNIISYARTFDADEHAKMWIENMHTTQGVPQSIRALIEDADYIKDMLENLADKLQPYLYEEE